MCISANCLLGCIIKLCVLSLAVPFIDIVTTTVSPSISITKLTTITSSTILSVATSSVTSSSSEPSALTSTIIALLASFIGGIMCVLLIVILIIILLACKARKNRGVNDEQKDNVFEFGINTAYGRGGRGRERNLILGLNRAYDVKGEVETEAVYEELDTVEYEELPEVIPLHEELPHSIIKSDINAQAADPIAVNNDDDDTADNTADTTGYEEIQPAATVLITASNKEGAQEVPEDEHDYY